MPVNFDAVGLQSVDETLAQSFDIEKSVESAIVQDQLGAFNTGKTFDPTFDFTLAGSGDIPAALVIASDGDLTIAGISGGITILTRVKEGNKNVDFNNWEVSGKNFPGAS